MMATPEDGLVLDHAGEVLSFGCLFTTSLCWDSFELDMDSCGSSTYEGASDVSLFHTCLTFPPGTCRSVVVLLVFWFLFVVWVFCVCFCVSLQVLGGCFDHSSLDSRQCFTARSAKLKKTKERTLKLLTTISSPRPL